MYSVRLRSHGDRIALCTDCDHTVIASHCTPTAIGSVCCRGIMNSYSKNAQNKKSFARTSSPKIIMVCVGLIGRSFLLCTVCHQMRTIYRTQRGSAISLYVRRQTLVVLHWRRKLMCAVQFLCCACLPSFVFCFANSTVLEMTHDTYSEL
jgi:hypothetical protein